MICEITLKKQNVAFPKAMVFKPIAIMKFPAGPLCPFLFFFRTSGLFRLY